MNLNLELWVGMAAAALFYHYANTQKTQKAPATVYVLASVAVSVIVMLTIGQGAIGVLVGQAILFAVVFAYQKLRK
ncbi:MAG: hypothetical protein LH481_03680 [Burkholderiales bacterium]|nr:hypothetical protein [Burkholderiales bacterium]